MPSGSVTPAGGGGPAAGSYIPVADAAGVTVDSTTYADPVKGGGAKLTTLVFPANQGAMAIAQSGDAFPRWLMASDATDGLYGGSGSTSPYASGGELFFNSSGHVILSGNSGTLSVGVVDTNVGSCTNIGQLALGNGMFIQAGPGAPTVGGNVGSIYLRTDSGTLIVYQCTVAGTAGNATWVPFAQPGSPTGIVTSGALSTVTITSGAGRQVSTTRDVETVTPFSGDGTNNAATCAIALSPDNVTYSTLVTESIAAALNLTGVLTITANVRVPAGWYIKLTATHGTLGTTTYY